MPIWFHAEDVTQPIQHKTSIKQWLNKVLAEQGYIAGEINYIFCSDEYLLEVNREHLNHDYYTDIITFPYSEETSTQIDSDLFISTDRIKDNASQLGIDPKKELLRVIAHGILHQIGWNDKTDAEAKEMRKAEEQALNMFDSLALSLTKAIKL